MVPSIAECRASLREVKNFAPCKQKWRPGSIQKGDICISYRFFLHAPLPPARVFAITVEHRAHRSLLGRKRLLLGSGTRYFLNSLFSSTKFCKPVVCSVRQHFFFLSILNASRICALEKLCLYAAFKYIST